MKLVKSIGAVIAGFLTIVVLTSITDAVLKGTGVFPTKPGAYTSWILGVALVYRTIFTVLGGLVVTKLAPLKPMKHVLVLATIGVLIGIAGVVSGWNLVGYPHRYSNSLTVLTYPAIWYGGKLVGANGKK